LKGTSERVKRDSDSRKRELLDLNSRIRRLESEKKRFADRADSAEAELASSEVEIASLRSDVQLKLARIQTLERDVAEFESVRQQHGVLLGQNESLRRELEDLRRENEQLPLLQRRLEAELAKGRRRRRSPDATKVQLQLLDLKSQVSDLRGQVAEMKLCVTDAVQDESEALLVLRERFRNSFGEWEVKDEEVKQLRQDTHSQAKYLGKALRKAEELQKRLAQEEQAD
jgi:chromosome segregation ATPase